MNKNQELINCLQTIPWFQELSQEHFNQVLKIAHLTDVDKGQTLFSEGEIEENLYFVLEGRVSIEIFSPVRGRIRIFTAEPLDVIGWSSVTPVIRQRTATVRAVLDSRLIALDAKKLRSLCDKDHTLGYIIMSKLANVVAARLMATRLQLLDLYANPSGD